MAKVLKDFYLTAKKPENFFAKDGIFPPVGGQENLEALHLLSTNLNPSGAALIELTEEEQKRVDDFLAARENVEAAKEVVEEQPEEVAEEVKPLSDYTNDELREIAKLEKVEIKSNDNKNRIIEKIEAQRNA